MWGQQGTQMWSQLHQPPHAHPARMQGVVIHVVSGLYSKLHVVMSGVLRMYNIIYMHVLYASCGDTAT